MKKLLILPLIIAVCCCGLFLNGYAQGGPDNKDTLIKNAIALDTTHYNSLMRRLAGKN
ncbi:hypothetical protein ABZR88_13250 [Mucilaginibacter yixingensis]|uniref:hypothetical protein n=1 Tax=Mucilaginibacter yixingensis TaxID=1295612 RepID=UPI001475045F|nr:hypothetical protein [Mucilaginibacter yixingensis]